MRFQLRVRFAGTTRRLWGGRRQFSGRPRLTYSGYSSGDFELALSTYPPLHFNLVRTTAK